MSETWLIIVFLGGLELAFGVLWLIMWFVDRKRQADQQDTLKDILEELIVLNERSERSEGSDVRLEAGSRRPAERHDCAD